jgi:protein-S-isoprenylcysteine O-methyltransferase Ste14
VLATLLSAIAFAVAVCGLLALRRNLSLMPEARSLVTSGPYRFVRHPLYAAEILAAVAMVISHPALWAAVSLPPFIAVQLTRARFEERLLGDTFIEYAVYARRTRRLIPAIW